MESDYPGLRNRATPAMATNQNQQQMNPHLLPRDEASPTNDNDNNEETVNDNNNNNNGRTAAQQQQGFPRQEFTPPLRRNFFDHTHRRDTDDIQNGRRPRRRTSHLYVLISIFVAFLAIVSPSYKRGGGGGRKKVSTAIPENQQKPNWVENDENNDKLDQSLKGKSIRRKSTVSNTNDEDVMMDGHIRAESHKKVRLSTSIVGPDGIVSSNENLKAATRNYKHKTHFDISVVEEIARAAATATFSDIPSNHNKDDNQRKKSSHENDRYGSSTTSPPTTKSETHERYSQSQESKLGVNLFGKKSTGDKQETKNENPSHPLQRISTLYANIADKGRKGKKESQEDKPKNSLFLTILKRMIDPSLLQWANMKDSSIPPSGMSDNDDGEEKRDFATIATQIIDKILTSNLRLIAIANLLLAVTYLLHSAVADLFLHETMTGTHTATGQPHDDTRNGMNTNNRMMMGMDGGVGASESSRMHRSGRERLGGYLLFKLLLISAVVEPDTLDLLILLSWYTLLSFLKSLSYLAGVTIAHASASGQSPRRGVFKLLLTVLFCDLTAAAICAALFHGAGWGMVILLTCDCALLALDILTHLARYSQQILEERHQASLSEIEARQIQLHAEMRRDYSNVGESEEVDEDTVIEEFEEGMDEADENELEQINAESVAEENWNHDDNARGNELDESRHLDQEMELLETIHSRRLGILDYTAFLFELLTATLTIAHFLHIWSLHGVTFNLVDGVLALHLHSAISAAGKKIAERRNHNRIARDLDSFFENATEIELRKASAAGDVCCICLGTMSMGNVKKIGCGHLYHTHCLREVVERARSIEAARCPLCRGSVVDGLQASSSSDQTTAIPGAPPGVFIVGFGNNPREGLGGENMDVAAQGINRNGNVRGQDAEPGAAPQNQNQNEPTLFRFSTEGILPVWLPVPAFSFEIVRRPTGNANAGEDNIPNQPQQDQGQQNARVELQPQQPQPQPQQEQQQETSFWRRLLLIAGAVPMTPEEEALAISQLVDMFPQYDRADLLRELRDRGSAEGVVEAVLASAFTGVARAGAVDGDGLGIRNDTNNTTEIPLEENNNLNETHNNDLEDEQQDDLDSVGAGD